MKIRSVLVLSAIAAALAAAGCQESGSEKLRAAVADGAPVAMTYMVDGRGLCYAGFTNKAATTKVDDVVTIAGIPCSEQVRAAAAARPPVQLQYFQDELGVCYAALVNRAQKTSSSDVVAVTSVPCGAAALKTAAGARAD